MSYRKRRVFVSFDYDNDLLLKMALVGQSRLPDSPFDIEDWSMKESAREADWITEARYKIKRSDSVAVILGRRTYQARGVLKEVRLAIELNKDIFQIIGHKDSLCAPVSGAGQVYSWHWPTLNLLLRRVWYSENSALAAPAPFRDFLFAKRRGL